MHSRSAICSRSVEVVWEIFDTPTYIRDVIQHFCSKLVQHDVVCNCFSVLIFIVFVRYLNYSRARSVTLRQSDWDICGDTKWATVIRSLRVICAIITQTTTSFCWGISVSSTPMCRYVFVFISHYAGSPCLTLTGTTFHLNVDKFWWHWFSNIAQVQIDTYTGNWQNLYNDICLTVYTTYFNALLC